MVFDFWQGKRVDWYGKLVPGTAMTYLNKKPRNPATRVLARLFWRNGMRLIHHHNQYTYSRYITRSTIPRGSVVYQDYPRIIYYNCDSLAGWRGDSILGVGAISPAGLALVPVVLGVSVYGAFLRIAASIGKVDFGAGLGSSRLGGGYGVDRTTSCVPDLWGRRHSV